MNVHNLAGGIKLRRLRRRRVGIDGELLVRVRIRVRARIRIRVRVTSMCALLIS